MMKFLKLHYVIILLTMVGMVVGYMIAGIYGALFASLGFSEILIANDNIKINKRLGLS